MPTDPAATRPPDAPSPSPAAPANPPASPPSESRSRRRRLVLILVLLLSPILAALVLTRSPLTTAIVESRLEHMLGLDTTARSATIGLDGRLVLRDARFRVEGIPGQAAEFLRVERCVIRLDWSSPTAPRPTSIRLTRPTLVLSADTRSGTLNIDPLARLSPRGDPSTDLPEILADEVGIEIAEHSPDGTVRTLRRLVADARLGLSTDASRYELVVRERTRNRRPIEVAGVIDGRRMRFEVSAIDLARWGPESMPEPVRELVDNLDLVGTVHDLEIAVEPGRPARMQARLERVALNLPVDLRGRPTPADSLARMTEIRGSFSLSADGLTADLRGILEDLPYRAEVEYLADQPGEPFTCKLTTTGYQLTRDPALLPFLPTLVAERLRDFSAPTGTLDAEVIIQRPPAPTPSPSTTPSPPPSTPDTTIRGWVTIRDGRASFERFPYPFAEVSGVFFFDDDKVELQLAGRNTSTGATVDATGTFSPPTEDAAVELTVRARSVPIDHALRTGLRSRGGIIDALFAEQLARTLHAEGLLDADEPFSLGGTGDITVLVTRTQGHQGVWGWSAEASFPRLGIVPTRFPLPILARDIRLDIGESSASLAGGSFHTLDGRPLDIQLQALVDAASAPPDPDNAPPSADPDNAPAVPIRATIHADRLPVDARLRAALRLAPEARSGRAAEFLDRLGVVGSARIDASFEEVGDQSTWAVRAEPVELTARPRSLRGGEDSAPVRLDEVSGWLDLKPERASFELAALATGTHDAASRVRVTGWAGLGQDPPPYQIHAHADSFDATIPVERIADAFSPDAGSRLARARADFNPVGVADVALSLSSVNSDDADYAVELSRIRGGSLTLADTRLGFGALEGRVDITPGLARFAEVSGELTAAGVSGTRFALEGSLALAAFDDQAPPPPEEQSLHADITSLELASPLTDLALARALDDSARQWIAQLDPAGLLDASLTATTDASSLRLVGTATPRSLALTRRGERIIFHTVAGSIDFDENGARTESLTLEAADWRAHLRGGLARDPEGATSLEGSGTIDADGLPPTLRAVLPGALDDALAALEIDTTGTLTLDLPRLHARLAEQGNTLDAAGEVAFDRASAELGVSITEARGSASFTLWQHPEDPAPRFDIRLLAHQLRADGVAMSSVRAHILQGDRPGEVRVPEFIASCHGGTIAGSADLLRNTSDAPTSFDVRVRASDVRLQPVLDDLQLAAELRTRPPTPPTTPPTTHPDATRGVVSGELLFGGTVGDPAARRGRATFRVSDGRVLDFPLAMPLLEVSNLQLPTTGRFDLALISVYLEGNTVVFDELSAFASSIELYGYGTMALPEQELDLWFSSRATRPIPVVSDLLEGIRDELVTARVTGPLADAAVATVPLRTTGRLMDNLLSGAPTPEERRLDDIRQRAIAERERIRRAGERVRSLITVSPTAPNKPNPNP